MRNDVVDRLAARRRDDRDALGEAGQRALALGPHEPLGLELARERGDLQAQVALARQRQACAP